MVRFSIFIPTILSSTALASDLLIDTTSGPVEGFYNSSSVRAFLGIPYAEPATGLRRFKPPVPISRSNQTIQVNSFPATCPGQYTFSNESIWSVLPYMPWNTDSMSEDCLAINVWAPKAKKENGKFAVMMYIYGGGFTQGGSAIPFYDGTNLVEEHQDIVVVTFNYRVSIFGYPNAPGLEPGQQNVGLLDQRLAVEWVHRNIGQFGGDPSRIMLFGQSAGAASTDLFTYAVRILIRYGKYPHNPIVHGVIMQSGAASIIMNEDKTHQNWQNLSQALGCSSLQCMQDKPWEEILEGVSSGSYSFSPVPDNVTAFADYEARAKQGGLARLPTLIGGADREGSANMNLSSKSINETLVYTATQSTFNCPIVETVDNRLEQDIPTWRYLYHGNWSGLSPTPWLGAYHSSDVPIVFGTYNNTPIQPSSSPAEVAASKYIQGAWVAFAKDPWNGLNNYGWPQFTSQNQSLVNLALDNRATATIGSAGKWDSYCRGANNHEINISKTGCRTCRARRVKCDETPGSCRNCISTGRKCEYDIQRLPRRLPGSRPTGESIVLSTHIADGFWWKITSDERRCFSFFQHRSLPTVIGYFDSPLWQRLVLQMSQVDQAVYHAVVAFSAIHVDYEARGNPLTMKDLDNSWQRFAVDQCGKAYALLTARSASRDPNLQEVTLVCCMLFVLSELMRGYYDLAFTHLRNGLQILKDVGCRQLPNPSPTCAPIVEQSLVDTFCHLDVQSAYFGVGELVLPVQSDVCLLEWNTGNVEPFQHLCEARRVLDSLMGAVFQFHTFVSPLSRTEIGVKYGYLSQRQFDLGSQLRRFAQAFDPLYMHLSTRCDIKGKRGADIIYLHQLSLSMILETCLLGHTKELLDYYTPAFRKLVALAEAITTSFTERPSILLHMGVIAPLFFVSTECSEPEVRWRAIRALQSWPHREGTWDSSLVARIAIETMTVEEQAVQDPDQASHVSHAFTIVSPEDASSAQMLYTLDGGGEIQSRTLSLE
ncbi:Alpha/Beta hydrolase protein [Aspergillus pseudotamarii]|uniref:Alpha/Beta hydrolase protein n=1 Tax=Aspergillus pseudotamarii TaxID=132259 RepID=A0A5N6TBB9_ASPPS|nr:Alpha/Beta hydrolase protein [Aspergillus pseudotamarii]KAE8143623.1 Alpha/Beta hydrolase protein [Aspergillus pseudotamarii]